MTKEDGMAHNEKWTVESHTAEQCQAAGVKARFFRVRERAMCAAAKIADYYQQDVAIEDHVGCFGRVVVDPNDKEV